MKSPRDREGGVRDRQTDRHKDTETDRQTDRDRERITTVQARPGFKNV